MNRQEGLIRTFFCNDLLSRFRLGNQSLTSLFKECQWIRGWRAQRIRFPAAKYYFFLFLFDSCLFLWLHRHMMRLSNLFKG